MFRSCVRNLKLGPFAQWWRRAVEVSFKIEFLKLINIKGPIMLQEHVCLVWNHVGRVVNRWCLNVELGLENYDFAFVLLYILL